MVDRIVEMLVAERAVCTWDICGHNDGHGLGRNIDRIVRRTADVEIAPVDRQTYYAATLQRPGGRAERAMRPTVLVVDDDDDIRELTRVALELVADWGVLTAAGGAEALELAARHRPDAVLLDLMMPGMDGLTTFRHLRADPATGDIPVILVTAKARVGERQAWDELEIAGVISKPFDPIDPGRRRVGVAGLAGAGLSGPHRGRGTAVGGAP